MFRLIATSLNAAVAGSRCSIRLLLALSMLANGWGLQGGEPPAEVDAIVAEAIVAGKFPGCVIAAGTSDGLLFLKAYGKRQLKPSEIEMTPDTLFDLASLTKPIATATSAMILIEEGKLELDAPISRYLPEFAANGKADIPVRALLIHTTGLIPDSPLKDYEGTRAESIQKIFELKPTVPPGSKFIYSDMGFVVLGELVAKVSGQPLDQFARERIFEPTGMKETGYLPPAELRQRAATTQEREGRWMVGEVHDPRAYKLDGVAGHAGLFSTASDLALYARAMLNSDADRKFLKPETWKLMGTPNEVPINAEEKRTGMRGLGWDMRSTYSRNRPSLLSDAAFGHSGFTGTSIWIDPGTDLYVIFLSNRVHPDGKGVSNPTASQVGDVVAKSRMTVEQPQR